METKVPFYHFGQFRLDPAHRRLEESGMPVSLPSRCYDILLVLLEHRDRVLSRAEITQTVWPGIVVVENNLSVQMSKLRRALGDTDEDAKIIATIPGRGYRFVAPLHGDATDAVAELPPATPAVAAQPKRSRWLAVSTLGAAAALAAIAWGFLGARKTALPLSIVVMPLRDLSDRPDQTYLADAISDDLTTDLAHLPGATVIARETADSYKGHATSATEIGRALGVRYLLEGSLRAEGAVLHVNAQLIETAAGTHLWAQNFDVPRSDPGLARDTIVRRIASSLDVELVQVESTRAHRDRPNDPTALDFFFQARSILDHDDSLAGFRAAQAKLEQAIALQPDFTDALAALAEAIARKVLSVQDPEAKADLSNARALASRALAISPRHPTALAARSLLFFDDHRIDEAAYAARDALAIEPMNLTAQAVLARCALEQGRLEQSAAAFQTILRLNPNGASNKSRLLMLGQIRLLQGHVPEAADLAQRAIAGDPPPSPGADPWGRAEGVRMLLIAARAMSGQMQEARALYAGFNELWPHRTVWRIGATAAGPIAVLPGFRKFLDALHAAGMPSYADEHVDDHIAPSSKPFPDDDFLAIPLTVPGAATIDTAGLLAMQGRQPCFILDLGSGSAVIPGATIRAPAERNEGDAVFIDSTVAHARPGTGNPIVVLADGVYGSTSYNAALHLLSLGFHKVLWYRGGEEAWAASASQTAARLAQP